MIRSLTVFAAFSASAVALPPSDATKDFLTNHSGSKAKIDGTKVVALYGPSLGSNSEGTPTEFTQAWMNDADNADALGVDGVTHEMLGSLTCREGLECVSFVQTIDSLPVHGSAIKALVRTGTANRIAYVGARIIPNPGSPLPSDVYSAAQAESAVESAYPDMDTFGAATKVVFQSTDGVYHRAWRLYGWDDEGEVAQLLFFVDTASNQVVGAIPAVLHADVNGTVTGYYTPCCPRDDPEYPACCGAHSSENPPVSTVLPDVKVRALEQTASECPVPEGTGEQYTCSANPSCGDDGTFEFLDVPGSYDMVTSSLTGQWVRVHDCDGRYLPGCPADAKYSVIPRPLSCVAIPPYSDIEIAFPPSEPGEHDVAMVTAFLGVERSHDWFKGLLPDLAGIDTVLPTGANASVVGVGANALYAVGQGLAFTASGEQFGRAYQSTAMPSVVTHEYAHFVQDVLHGWANTDTTWREATADVASAFLWGTQYMGQGVYDDETLAADANFIRRLDEPDVRITAPFNEPSWCPFSQDVAGHCHGLALGGAFWDLRELLLRCSDSPTTPCTSDADCGGSAYCTDETAERLFADYLCCSLGSWDSSVLSAVLSVDDDENEDIADGTDHAEEIIAAFSKHGWVFAESEINVAWVGPSPSPGPIEGVDYTVDYQCDPPCVTLITTEKTENGQPVEVERWIIGAVDDAQPPTPLDIGRIDAAWEGDPHIVTVQVGSTDTDALKVANVHIVNPVAQDGMWTDLQLNLTGSLIGLAQAFPNGTSGGRVSGSIDGSAAEVQAYAIGIGANEAGTLMVGSELSEMHLAVLPGTGQTGGASKVFSGSIGAVSVDGNIDGEVTIRGDSAGSLVADGDAAGPITANRGDFNGNICGDDLADWEPNDPIPGNLDVVWGPSGTICGNVVCEEESAPDEPDEEPSPAPKNRFLSFVVPDNDDTEVAIRVRLRSLNGGDPDYVRFEGAIRYVNAVSVDGNCTESANGETTFKCAKLGCEPDFRDWGDLGDGGTWHVTGDAVIPNSIYAVEIIRRDANDAQCPSVTSLEVRTTELWGDVDGSGTLTILDVAEIGDQIRDVGDSTYVQTLLWTQSPLDGVNVLSLSKAVDALKGGAGGAYDQPILLECE